MGPELVIVAELVDVVDGVAVAVREGVVNCRGSDVVVDVDDSAAEVTTESVVIVLEEFARLDTTGSAVLEAPTLVALELKAADEDTTMTADEARLSTGALDGSDDEVEL